MADTPTLVDQYGRPIVRELLTQEIAGPTITGVRSPISGHQASGLNPRRLAQILREADEGYPLRYFELAEQIEERDLHYVGVLATRKRAVAQLEMTVDAASDDPADVATADEIRAWLARDELQEEIFNILDAIGKGVSYTEIVWDTSSGQWRPDRLIWRDPRFFRFKWEDGTTPLLRGDQSDDELPPFKFIKAVIRAKSGHPVRSGIARIASWMWMFKAFTQRDWAIFTQTYGQPVRVGKYPAGTSQGDKDTLFRAVANIAGDCAAIVPESMIIDFVESSNVGPGSDLFMKRADWLDQQVSKAVLGQTATTDAIAGGHAVGQEHRQVQEDIERADARTLAAILNRDLIRVWIDLERGPQQQYPRLRIGRPDDRDVKQTIDGIVALLPMGLRVEKSFVNDLLGIPDADPLADVLTAPAAPIAIPFGGSALQSAAPVATKTADAVAALATQAEHLVSPAADALIDEVRAVVARCSSLPELRDELKRLKPALAERNIAGLLRMAMMVANLTGRAALAAEIQHG